MVAGQGMLLRFESGAWKTVSLPEKFAGLRWWGISQRGEAATLVGESGNVLWSQDGGKTWTETSSRLLQCIEISIPSLPDSGACAFRCDPKMKGKDCPPLLQSCRKVTVGSQTFHACAPPGTLHGSAKVGESCSPYEGASPTRRCAKGLTCQRVPQGYTCLEPCSRQASSCSTAGERCTWSAQLKGSFCAKEAATQGKACDLAQRRFCAEGHFCAYSLFTQSGACQALGRQKHGEFCLTDPSHERSCEAGLVCTGSAATPYRQVCLKPCIPGQGSKCSTGFVCLPEKEGGGVCVKACDGAPDACTTLPCRQLFTTSPKRFCL